MCDPVVCLLPAQFIFQADRAPVVFEGKETDILRQVASHDIDRLMTEYEHRCRSGKSYMIYPRFSKPTGQARLLDLGFSLDDLSSDDQYIRTKGGVPSPASPNISFHWTSHFRFSNLEYFVRVSDTVLSPKSPNEPNYLTRNFVRDSQRCGWAMNPKPGYNWVGRGRIWVDSGSPEVHNLLWFREDWLKLFLKRCWIQFPELLDIRVCPLVGDLPGDILQDYVLSIPGSRINDHLMNLPGVSTSHLVQISEFLEQKVNARKVYEYNKPSGASKLLKILESAIGQLQKELTLRSLPTNCRFHQ